MDKAIKPMIGGVHPLLSYVSPNLSELRAMYKQVTGKKAQSTNTNGSTSEEFLMVTMQSSPVLSSSPHHSLPLLPSLLLSPSFSHSCTLSLILSLPPSLSPSLPPSLRHFLLPSELSLEDKLSECIQLTPPLLEHIPNIVVSLGKDGVLFATQQKSDELFYYPAAADHLLPARVLSVTGAGDRLVNFSPILPLLPPQERT